MKMTRFNSIKYLLPIAISVSAAGCSDELMPDTAPEGDTRLPISLSAAYPTASRASDAGFEGGDIMGVYVLDYEGDTPSSIKGEKLRAKNIRFTFDATDNRWRGVADIYWKDKTTPADIIGYYPWRSDVTDPEAMPHTIARRQDIIGTDTELGGYEASDLLLGKSEKTMPTSERVELTLNHLMAGVRVTLAEGTGFAEGEWSGLEKTALVSNVIPSGTVNLTTGESVPGTADPISVTPMEYGADFRAVVFPQTIAAGKELVAVSVGGDGYSLKADRAMTYAPGKLHSFTITVNKKEAGVMEFVVTVEGITAWIDDVDFRDGLIRSYTLVNVTRKGTFENTISSMGIDPSKIYNLKLTGEINDIDFRYIRNNMIYLKAINLYGAEVYDETESGKGIIPFGAFSDMRTLNHIIFPKNLKIISTAAFSNTGLIGDLILPEGLTHLGTRDKPDDENMGGIPGPFGGCSSLTGKLYLPSTLTFIEGRTFDGTVFTSELLLPESITYIGPYAFKNNNFSGTLHIPENIKEVGTGAFLGVPFSGELKIPQGIKVIEPFTFCGGNYGLVNLPEGISDIKNNAFAGCQIRGELKLPSTLMRLGDNTFSDNKISSIVFPDDMVYLGSECFKNNTRLSGTLALPQELTVIKHGAFSGCSTLDEIIMGENISKIEGEAFAGCYNLSSIVITTPEPPLLTVYIWDGDVRDPFKNVPKDNFTVQVPEKSVDTYRHADGWKEFKRFAAYSNFVCRPATACALTTAHNETLVLNSDGAWTATHIPDWVTLSKTSGTGKTEISLEFHPMAKGSGNREDYVEFALEGTEFTTRCEVRQYDYEHDEDACITLQEHGTGSGIDVLFIAEGFDGEAISNGSYLELVNEQMEAFFGVEPYTTYRDYFNVYACISLSQENGINTDNLWRRTRFNALYSMGKLLVDDADMVFDYAVAKSPLTRERMSQSLIVMTLNSDEYGSASMLTDAGSAISMLCRSSDPYPMDTRGIVQHEACGHAFGKLAEERINQSRYLNKAEISTINDMHERGWYQNISTTGKLSDVSWGHFIFDPRYSVKVDVFEGGFGVSRGCFRAEINSCMNYGIPYFSAPARQDIVRRILEYSGEGFTMEKFYAKDSDKWGSTGNSRAAGDIHVVSAIHYPVTIVKSKKY